MDTQALLTGFTSSPDFLLQNFNFKTKLALVVQVKESAYRTAAFLDQRVFTPATVGAWLPLPQLCAAAAVMATPVPPYYIAHVGHCGSTLVSRLLAELPGNLPVREPIALLALALVRRNLDQPTSWVDPSQWQRYYDMASLALARTYRPGERALIKLTSNAGNLLEVIAAPQQAAPQILLMYVSLEVLLAAMLRTSDMRDSIHVYSAQWVTDFRRLTGRADIRLVDLSDAQQVAVKWLTLMLLFTRTAAACPAETLLLNFTDFLRCPAEQLARAAMHFHLAGAPEKIEQLTNGPLMRRHSKIPKQPFNPGQRAAELRAACQQFGEEIRAGLRWAERLCQETPSLAVASASLISRPT